MSLFRLIARLDIKGQNLINTIHLEGLRVVGDPATRATGYYNQGIDEFIYMDIVASLYNRNNLKDVVAYTAEHLFVPLTVGGGIRTVENAHDLLRSGADKVAVNTAAIANPRLIEDLAEHFGKQCVVLSIEAKQIKPGRWECYTDNGRESTGRDVVAWAAEAVALGAGEVLVTSVDREGTRRGFDVALSRAVADAVNVPVIASGGMGHPDHLRDVASDGGASGAAMADCLHFDRLSLDQIRTAATEFGIPVRQP